MYINYSIFVDNLFLLSFFFIIFKPSITKSFLNINNIVKYIVIPAIISITVVRADIFILNNINKIVPPINIAAIIY